MPRAQSDDPVTTRQLRETVPVHRINAGGWHNSWMVTGYDITTAVLSDSRLLGNAEAAAEPATGDAESGRIVVSEAEPVNPGPQHAADRRRAVDIAEAVA